MKRPVLRYFGGKFKLASWIESHFAAHDVYVEPFGGGASVLMAKDRAQIEIYNDLDSEIVNVFRVLRDRPDELGGLLRLTPYAEAEYAAAYEPAEDTVERARRTIVRSFQGLGADSIHRKSGFRKYPHRRIGRHSQTICAHEWRTYPDHIETFAGRLRGVQIECGDAIELMRRYDTPKTLHYVDPPYVMSARKTAEKRYGHEMNDDDHRALASALKGLSGMVVLSGYRSQLYDELYDCWHRDERRFYDSTEVLWRNEAAVRGRNDGMLPQTIFDVIEGGAA